MKKFELSAESKTNCLGRTLYRIKACIDFTCTDGYEVHAGDLGGYVEKEQNLSHDGNAWLCGDAEVWGDAMVYGDAVVYGDAMVYGNAKVCGNAKVWGDAEVWGDASLSSPDQIFNVAPIGENANSLTLFRTKASEISISFEWDLYSIEDFISHIENWSEKHKKTAWAAIDIAKMHIDLDDHDELQPCPFCGEEAELEDDPEGYHVTCSESVLSLAALSQRRMNQSMEHKD